jgi:signal peptidase II
MLIVFLVSFFIVLLDQFFKFGVYSILRPTGRSFVLINNVLDLVYVENTGAAFGFFKEGRFFFIVFTTILLILFLWILKRKYINSLLFSISGAFLIGGGLGNLIDRIFRGFVIDYIHLSFFYPVCNLADYCVTIGAVGISIYLLFCHQHLMRPAK